MRDALLHALGEKVGIVMDAPTEDTPATEETTPTETVHPIVQAMQAKLGITPAPEPEPEQPARIDIGQGVRGTPYRFAPSPHQQLAEALDAAINGEHRPGGWRRLT